MFLKFLSKCRLPLLLIGVLLLNLPLIGCGIIIINDVSGDNPSNYETTENFSPDSSETAYTPMEYTPYRKPEDPSAVAEGYLSKLPERNFDGAVFFITTPDTDYIDPDNAGTNVTKEIIERNRRIEERYNISLLTSKTDARTILAEVQSAVNADTYYTDLMMSPVYLTGQFRMAKVLMNLRSLPFLDLTAPYFNSSSVAMTTAGYETTGVAGYASLSPSAFTAVYFNRDILAEAGLEEPYSLVTSGKWTWDRLFEYAQYATDVNESGTGHYYTYGSQNNPSRMADLIFSAYGNGYVRTVEKTSPLISFTPNTAKAAVDTAHRILTDSAAVMDSTAGAVSCFGNGEMMFLFEYLYVMPWITNSAADWGLVPLPTAKEGEPYRTLVSNNELIFTVPVHHKNGELVSVILSALNASSAELLYDEYIDNALYNVVRDNDSVNMLDLILDTAVFDFALAFGNAYPTIADGTYGLIRQSALNNDLSERYEAAVEKTTETLEEYFGVN